MNKEKSKSEKTSKKVVQKEAIDLGTIARALEGKVLFSKKKAVAERMLKEGGTLPTT